jgi:hypothetical protein
MRKLRWGLAVLGLGAAVSVASAQGKFRTGQDNGLLTEMFSSSASKTEPASGAKADGKTTAKPGSTRSAWAKEHDRLMKAYTRRMAVCDRLANIARETGDDRLQREAESLNALAWKIYEDRATQLREAQAGRAEATLAEKKPAPKPAPRGLLSDRFRMGGLNSQGPERSVGAQEDER